MKILIFVCAILLPFTLFADDPKLTLSWNDNSDNEAGFLIERSSDGAEFFTLANVPADTVGFEDFYVERGSTYWYRVKAHNMAGDSAFSNVASATVPPVGVAPTGPDNLKLTIPGELINLSDRGLVGLDEGTKISGMSIAYGPVEVVIRGIGPGLNRFGVVNTIGDPRLSIKNQAGVEIASNDNWGGTADLVEAFALTGAFTLEPGSNDAAILITLQPGLYTVHLTDANGDVGIGLLEAYKVTRPKE